jgi:hypothetical protein
MGLASQKRAQVNDDEGGDFRTFSRYLAMAQQRRNRRKPRAITRLWMTNFHKADYRTLFDSAPGQWQNNNI